MQAGWLNAQPKQFSLGDFRLESGELIRDAFVSYVTHGTLNEDRTNAVLALSAIGSSHHRLDFLIGPGKALDPQRWFVICVDALGNGLSSSPSNSAAQPYETFPRFSIRDMVQSQFELLQEMGIPTLQAVVGASMGGMQAIQWAVSHPHTMRRIVAMTPMARTTPWAAAINEAARCALMADPRWAEPGYFSTGLPGWISLMQLISGRTPRAVDDEYGTGDELRTWIAKRVTWQQGQMVAPIDWVYQSFAYDAHDVGATRGFAGNTSLALASITAPTLVLAPPLDLYNPAHAARAVADGIPEATFLEIPSTRGHSAAGPARLADARWINDAILHFLNSSAKAFPA